MTNYDEMPPYFHNNDYQDSQNIDASQILKDITFVRLNLEDICMNEEDEFINEVIRRRSLFGFILEYQFPSLDAASTSLKARIRVHAKSYNGSVIHFRHKRVIRIKMLPELVNLWKRSAILLAVYAKLNTLGKYSMKRLGTCEVPLQELVIPPFIICRDFLFVGPGFSASALIKIDLGSHIRLLMERLEMMRNGNLPQSGSATRARSRSSSRKGLCYASRLESPLPVRRAFSSSPPRVSRIADQVEFFLAIYILSYQYHLFAFLSFFSLSEKFLTTQKNISVLRPFPPPLTLDSSSPPITPLSSPHLVPPIAIRELCPTSPSYRIKLTVYSARRLPLSFNSRGEAVAPSTYLTVIGEDGRTLSSPVRAGTLHPEWNWTEIFNVSRSRKNLIVKLWKRCVIGSDKVIGFISLHLPPTDVGKAEYEMSNLSVSDQAPLITLSISCETFPYAESHNDTPLLTSSPVPFRPSRTSPRLQNMTKEEIYEKLRKNISELKQLVERYP